MIDMLDPPYRPFELAQWARLMLPILIEDSAIEDAPLAAQLERQNDFLWAVMNNSPNVSIVCLDKNYCYLFFNRLHHQRMKSILNVDIYLGQPLLGYLSDDRMFERSKLLIDRALGGEVVNDVQIYGPDTPDRTYFDSIYSPLYNNQDRIIGVIITSTDVTLTKKAEESLRQSHDELESKIARRTAELQQITKKLHGQLSERDQFQQTIRESEERFRSTFEQSTTAIVLTDQDLTIQLGNQAFTLLTGYPLAEIIGQPLPGLLDIPDFVLVPFWEQLPMNPGYSWQTETEMVRKDGRTHDVLMSITAVYAANGDLLEYVVQMRNISLRRQLERAQQQFITTTSHELRTPLTNIRLYLQLLEKRPENQPKYLRVLNREVARLQTLLGDIMEITALTASGGASSWQSVSPMVIVNSAVNNLHREAAAKDLTLFISPLEEEVPLISGDPARLKQALCEIVENAINFTQPDGKIIISTNTQELNNRLWMTIAVQDSGPGIPADEQSYVFERFFRGAMSESGSIPGTGLGLSIADAIIKAHGGRIIVESLVGVGSVFTVLLPVNQ